MFEVLCSQNTGGFIPTSLVSLLFLSSSNLGVSCRQACKVSLRNAAYWIVVWEGLTVTFTLKLPEAAPCCELYLHDGMTDSCSPRGGGR